MRDEFRLDGGPDDDPMATLLHDVLHRQADAAQPSADGLHRIRAEIARQAPRPATRLLRHWTPLLAAAAVLVVLVGAGGLVLRLRDRVASRDAASAGGALVMTMDRAEVQNAPSASVPVYVIGHQAGREVLFREFRHTQARDVDGMVEDAVRLAVTKKPLDPDYTNVFGASPSTRVTAQVTPTQIRLDISPAPAGAQGVTAADAEVAKQQLVWTATAATAVAESAVHATPGPSAGALQAAQRPVSITLDGQRGGYLFGLAQLDHGTSAGLIRHAHVQGYQDPRADVWIGDLTQGEHRGVGRLKVTGDAVARADGRVHVMLVRGTTVVQVATLTLDTSEESGFENAPRAGERGHWSADLDLTRPGTYTLLVWTGTGPAPDQDPDQDQIGQAQTALTPVPNGVPTPASAVEADSKTISVG